MSGGSGLSSGVPNATGDLGAMMALLADPAALKAQYADFAARKKAADDAIKLVGPAQEVLRLREESVVLKAQAEAALSAARASAEKMVADAKALAATTVSEAKSAADKATLAAAAKSNAAKAATEKLEAAQADLVERERELHKAQLAADQRESNLNANAVDLALREQKLKDKIAQHVGVLGSVAKQLDAIK